MWEAGHNYACVRVCHVNPMGERTGTAGWNCGALIWHVCVNLSCCWCFCSEVRLFVTSWGFICLSRLEISRRLRLVQPWYGFSIGCECLLHRDCRAIRSTCRFYGGCSRWDHHVILSHQLVIDGWVDVCARSLMIWTKSSGRKSYRGSPPWLPALQCSGLQHWPEPHSGHISIWQDGMCWLWAPRWCGLHDVCGCLVDHWPPAGGTHRAPTCSAASAHRSEGGGQGGNRRLAPLNEWWMGISPTKIDKKGDFESKSIDLTKKVVNPQTKCGLNPLKWGSNK